MTGIDWPIIAGIAIYAGLEYWLGRTDKTKSGSVLEAVGHGLKAAAGIFIKTKDPNKYELPKK